MAIHRLTPRQIDAVQKNGRLNDGGGLTLEVRMGRTGWRRYWIFRQTVDGRSLSKGLGSYPKTSLKEARKLAGELREKVEETGVIEDVPDQTFLSFARCWMVDNQREHWEPMFRNHAGNILDKALADIKIQHILGILRPVWQSKPTVAKKLRQRLNRVFSAANTLGLMRGNPARWEDGLKNLLPVQDHTSEPFVALPAAMLPGTYRRLCEAPPCSSAFAVRFMILTAARGHEVRRATWDQIDVQRQIWTVPPENSKTKRAHAVPLSEEALAVLTSSRQESMKMSINGVIFPSLNSATGQLSQFTLGRFFKSRAPEDQQNATLHGTARGTFSTWAREQGWRDDTIEYALAHKYGSEVLRSYRHTTVFEERGILMSDWATFLKTGGARRVVDYQDYRDRRH